jgi:hypothetical protein
MDSISTLDDAVSRMATPSHALSGMILILDFDMFAICNHIYVFLEINIICEISGKTVA